MRSAALALALLVGAAAPCRAQGAFDLGDPGMPAVTVRGFVDVNQQWFAANNTFENVFGEATAPFWGIGAQVVGWEGRIYGEVGLSRIARENNELVGERVFVSSGTVYPLGIPLRSTIKPWKVVGGYRFQLSPRLVPYAGVGVTSYAYVEESDFALPAENLDVTRRGFVFQGGLEVRGHRWVGFAAGVEKTRVTGILGEGGLSRLYTSGDLAGGGDQESDLGGWALQFRLIIGR
jgi:hypothetical protein